MSRTVTSLAPPPSNVTSGPPSGPDLTGQIRRTEPWTRGHGALTDVYIGEWNRPRAPPIIVAIKIFRGLHNDYVAAATMERRLVRESRVWCTLRHGNILPYFGYCSCPDVGPSMALISPFCRSGTVMTFLENNTEANRISFVRDVISGLAYLHSQNVIHSDLHKNNILVDDYGRGRLCDFGRARIMGHEGYISSLAAGNAEYMAPELFPGPDDEYDDAELPYTKMSDVYAFSMVAFEIFTGRTPFQRGPRPAAMPSTRVVPRVQRGDRPSRQHDKNQLISDTFWGILERCWRETPEDRDTIVQVARIVGI